MSSSRNTGIDTLRGIGVLVVFMVHAGISGTLLRGALVIAVPLFYLVAGYTCKDTGTLRGLVTCKFRRLIVPFMFYAAAGLAIYTAGNCLLLHKPMQWHLFNILSADRTYLPYPAALWFFLSIFWCYMLHGAISRITRSDTQRAALCLSVGVAGWILSRYAALPLSFDTSMSWLPFFYIGNMLARYGFCRDRLKPRTAASGAIVAIACCAGYVAAGYNAGYCYNIFVGSIPLIILLTLGATLGTLCACSGVGKIPVITYLGRNSLVVFAGHQHFMIIIRQSLEQMHVATDSALFEYLLAAASIAASIMTATIVRKIAPQLIGEQKLLRDRTTNSIAVGK